MKMKSKSLTFNVKADEKLGTFTAYGNTFGNLDHAGDMTMKGAFSKCIQDWKSKGKFPRLLSQHGHTSNPIGIITSMKEDENGLLFEGEFCTEAGTSGAEAYALVKMGALDSFSIGYNTLNEKMVNGVNELHELDVKEISLVTFACDEKSLIQTIKSAIDSGESPTTRMIQKALQEAGLSKRQSESAVNAIITTKKAETADLNAVELFKVKATSHTPSLTNLECKRDDMSLFDYASMIYRAVNSTIESDEIYSYVESIFMEYVIVGVCDYSQETYDEYYVRVPYSVSGGDNVMVGSAEKVTKVVKWKTEAEIAAYEAMETDREKEAPTDQEEEIQVKAEDDFNEEELSSVDFKSWFK
jgi:HK97 family phage prohead protease